jgi:NADH-quinone oxidoreductase subunit A
MEHSEDSILLWPFLVYGIAVVSLVSGMLIVSHFIGERHKEHATDQAYEGGIIATGTARLRFPIHFYIIAMFFIIFDIAAIFIISWAVAIREVGWGGYITASVFIGILFTALIYIWKIGALDFGPSGKKILKAYHTHIKQTASYDVVDKQGK